MGEKRCYSVGEIQNILGICKTTAYNLIKENQFRAMLIGGKYVISKKSFDEWLDGEINKSGQEQTQGEQKPEEKQERQERQQRKVGNRIYISEEEFRTWLKNREEGGIANGSDHGKKRQV